MTGLVRVYLTRRKTLRSWHVVHPALDALHLDMLSLDPTAEANSANGIVDEPFFLKMMAMPYAIRVSRELHEKTGRTVSLMVQKKNGRWQEERTYSRSGDPRRTPG